MDAAVNTKCNVADDYIPPPQPNPTQPIRSHNPSRLQSHSCEPRNSFFHAIEAQYCISSDPCLSSLFQKCIDNRRVHTNYQLSYKSILIYRNIDASVFINALKIMLIPLVSSTSQFSTGPTNGQVKSNPGCSNIL